MSDFKTNEKQIKEKIEELEKIQEIINDKEKENDPKYQKRQQEAMEKCRELKNYDPETEDNSMYVNCDEKKKRQVNLKLHPDKNPLCVFDATEACKKFDNYYIKRCPPR